MSLEAIETVNKAENENKARKAAAEQEAKEQIAQAEKMGLRFWNRCGPRPQRRAKGC